MDTLVVPATLESLEPLGHYVIEAARAAGLEAKAAYRLRLAVDELATNIFMHGYSTHIGMVRLEASIQPDSLIICIEDTGPAFDPRVVEAPDLNLPPEERPVGGLGVYLVTQSVDKLDYERAGNRNRTTLTMRRPK